MNHNLNNPISCQIYRSKMISITITTFISLFVMQCYGMTLSQEVVTESEMKALTESSNRTEGTQSDLMKVILDALESAKLTSDKIIPNRQQVESLVLELSPEKRKVLNEILGLVVNQPQDSLLHKPQNLKNLPQVAKDIEVFTLPTGKTINVHELLKYLLEPRVTTTSELEHLRKLIYDSQMTDLKNDPVLKRTFNKFIFDTNLQSHEIDHID